MGIYDEIVSGGPYAVYIAPYGTARPPLAAIPQRPWVLLGANGAMNMTEDGITINQGQTLNKIFALGTTAAVKVYRIREELDVSFSLMDLTLENWNHVLNGVGGAVNVHPPDTGVGWKEIPVRRLAYVQEFAALIRMDVSPYDSNFTAELELYRAYQSADLSFQLDKGSNPAALNFTFSTLWSPLHQSNANYRAMHRPAG